MFSIRKSGADGRHRLVEVKEKDKKGMQGKELDLISEIGDKKSPQKKGDPEYSSEDEILDEMAKFVEG